MQTGSGEAEEICRSAQGPEHDREEGETLPVECVVRGYLAGSGWKDYGQSGSICGIKLPEGYVESSKLASPIFTPTTKAEEGHDMNVSFDEMCRIIGLRWRPG
jgi:phosphoribosylaminoimidazole-succinocarboxamide synthase